MTDRVVFSLILALVSPVSVFAQDADILKSQRDHTWLDFHTLTDEVVHKELQLSDDQIRRIAELQVEYRAAAPRAPKRRREMTPEEQREWDVTSRKVSLRVDAEYRPRLAAILNADQNSRLREIEIQSLLWSHGLTAADAPEIAEPLQVTNDQKKMLSEIRLDWYQSLGALSVAPTPEEKNRMSDEALAKRDAAAGEVLTADQKAKLAKIQGQPFDIPKLIERHWNRSRTSTKRPE